MYLSPLSQPGKPVKTHTAGPLAGIYSKSKPKVSRRKFIGTATTALIGTSAFGMNIIEGCTQNKNQNKDIVSIVRVKDSNVANAVKEAIDLLGGTLCGAGCHSFCFCCYTQGKLVIGATFTNFKKVKYYV